MQRSLRFALLASLFLLLGSALPASAAAPWIPFGPFGGDARSFAVDPKDHAHIYLGTANGWIYQSHNGGERWERLAEIGKRDDLVLDHIVVDRDNPKRLLVGVWALGSVDGGLYLSTDAGHTWKPVPDLQGQSVRALSSAPSDPKIIVAGTVEGVFRSTDSGEHWKLISPEASPTIHGVESVAIDPIDPGVIYAGTWHLPWKTGDSGEHWNNIKEGIIDDSDVFSIIVDPKDPSVVYASACSGIYKSDDAGDLFHKIQGIPSTARRTRVLAQDPQQLNVVYAGTTEGLFRTEDSGKSWTRTTGPEVIVNDVYIDPADSNHILLATDRGGVLASHDAGTTFAPSNDGFAARQITGYVADPDNKTIYVSVVNDKQWGGVFLSDNGGLTWTQQSAGLEGRDVFSLGRAPDGTVLAGTNHGIFRLSDSTWTRADVALHPPLQPPNVTSPPATSAKQAFPTKPKPHTAAPPRPAARPAAHSSPAPNPRSGHRASAPKHTQATALHSVRHTARFTLAALFLRTPQTSGVAAPKRKKSAPETKPAAKHTKSPPAAAPPAAAPKHTSPNHHIAAAPHPANHVGKQTSRGGESPSASPSSHTPAGLAAASAKPAFDSSTFTIVPLGQTTLAATSEGLLQSSDSGQTWTPVPGVDRQPLQFLAANGNVVVAGTLKSLLRSTDSGQTWTNENLPDGLTQITALAVDNTGATWVGGREGIYSSTDAGQHWEAPKNLYLRDINSIYFDAPSRQLLITGNRSSSIAFALHLPDNKLTFWDTGWNLRFFRPVADHFIGATLFDGMVVQPRMVDSPETPAHK